jgi:hypothetical protein
MRGLAVAACALVVGCSSAAVVSDPSPVQDAGVELPDADAIDAGAADAPRDVAREATPVVDAAPAPVDAGPPPPPPGLLCSRSSSGTYCTGGESCCWNADFGVGTCKGSLSACPSGNARFGCAGRVDCAQGEICCVTAQIVSSRVVNARCSTDAACVAPTSDHYVFEGCSWIFPTGECTGGKQCLGGDFPFGLCR